MFKPIALLLISLLCFCLSCSQSPEECSVIYNVSPTESVCITYPVCENVVQLEPCYVDPVSELAVNRCINLTTSINKRCVMLYPDGTPQSLCYQTCE